MKKCIFLIFVFFSCCAHWSWCLSLNFKFLKRLRHPATAIPRSYWQHQQWKQKADLRSYTSMWRLWQLFTMAPWHFLNKIFDCLQTTKTVKLNLVECDPHLKTHCSKVELRHCQIKRKVNFYKEIIVQNICLLLFHAA